MLGCGRVACGRDRRAIGRHAPQILSRGGILPEFCGDVVFAGAPHVALQYAVFAVVVVVVVAAVA